MVNIKEFKVNKVVLLLSIIRKLPRNGDWKTIERGAVKIDPAFSEIIEAAKNFTNNPQIYKKLEENTELMELIVQKLFETPKFKELYEEAENYKDVIEKMWEARKKVVDDYFTNTLKITKDKSFLVNVVDPNFSTGTNDMQNEIFWGSNGGQKENYSYDVTYIVHEAMHCLYPRDKELTNEQYGICHSLIELAIDNELRSRLGGNNSNYNKGHEDATNIIKELMPLWITFLNQGKNTLNFEIPCDEKFKANIELAQKNGVQNMNFTELMEHCISHYHEYGLDENTFNFKRENKMAYAGEEI